MRVRALSVIAAGRASQNGGQKDLSFLCHFILATQSATRMDKIPPPFPLLPPVQFWWQRCFLGSAVGPARAAWNSRGTMQAPNAYVFWPSRTDIVPSI